MVDDILDELMPELAAIALDGAKAVGKTATASQRAATVRKLDNPAVASLAAADPAGALKGPAPVLLDEWHRVPAVWDAVRRAVDDGAPAGQFLLTGSASLRAATHSGAGRIVDVRMRPMTLPERGASDSAVSLSGLVSGSAQAAGECALTLADYTELILATGFPGLAGISGRALTEQLDSYIARIITADLKEAGLAVRRPATVRNWLQAYAAAVSTTAAWEKIRTAATPGSDQKPAKTTTLPYIDYLTALRVLDDLPAWSDSLNHLRRLGKAPKHHLVDPGLAARLLNLTADDLLAGRPAVPRDGTYLGALFESLAALSVRTFAAVRAWPVSHCRTEDGRHEIDIIADLPGNRVLACEVKLSGSVDDTDVAHLRWLKERIGDRLAAGIVITSGAFAYRRPDGFDVVPLGLLGP